MQAWGMEQESVTLRLPRDLLSGAQRVATARDVSVGHLVRPLLQREVDRQMTNGRGEDADVRLLAALQALLAQDMAQARDWDDLAERLRMHGYEIRPSGGGVVLFKSSCNTRVCKGSEIGFSYGMLVKRFGGPMPQRPKSMSHLGTMPAGRIDPRRYAVVSTHMSEARNWPDLINRLAMSGMELRLLGTELGIYISTTGRHLCNSTTVGESYLQLVKRFGADLPTPLAAQCSGRGSNEVLRQG